MAEKLSITIALNGAEEIKRQLADVGQAGKDCFKDINDAAAEVGGFNKLDPSVITEKLKQTAVAGKDVAKVLTAVSQAGRMETLVNGIAAVENGLVKVQAAASALDAVLGRALLQSLTKIARFLPAAFAAATIGAIAKTTQSILELDAAAIKAGVSIQEMAKSRAIFEGLGLSSKDAATGVDAFQASIDKIATDKVQQAAADFKTFERHTTESVNAIRTLTDAVIAGGKAGELAAKVLEAAGLLRKNADEQELARILQLNIARSQQLLQAIALFERMGNTVERNRLILSTFGDAVGAVVIQMLNAGKGADEINKKLAEMEVPTDAATLAALRLKTAWEDLKTTLGTGFTVSPQGLGQVQWLVDGAREAIRLLGEAFVWLKGVADNLGLTQGFLAAIDVIQNTHREIMTIINALTTIANFGASMWDGIVQGASAAWQTIIGWIEMAIEAARKFFSMGGGQAAGAGAPGMARGGLMGGRGSGTSDSNLAWLSRGEHIMPAHAVRQPGVLQLLEALRRSGGNLRSVLDRMGHFAMGGLVGAPAFAADGINGMSHVTIQFPGLNPISGLRASGAVVDELRRAAALAQVRSGGRKPSRYS